MPETLSAKGARGSARALLQEHWPLLTILAAALLVRILVAIAYRPALFYSDSWSYVAHAYGPTFFAGDRPSGYPLLLRLIALPGRSLAVVTTVQHAAGLATGALAYALLRRLGVPRWPTCAATALIVLDAYAITLEQTILAEAFFTLTLVLSAFLVLGPGRLSLTVAISGVLLAAAATQRTAALFAVPVWLLYVAWRHRRPRVLVIAACAVAAPLLVYSAVYDAKVGRFGLNAADGWFLYGRVGEIADCHRFTPPPGTRHLCEPVHDGALYYLWSGRSAANRAYGQPGPAGSEPLGRYARAVIGQRPLAYGGMVTQDFLRYFQPNSSSPGSSDTAISLSAQPRVGSPWVYERYRARYFPEYRPSVHPPATVVRAYWSVVHPPRPLLALLVVATVAALTVGLVGRNRRHLPHRQEAFLLTGMGLAMLLGATATSEFIVRYLVPSVPLLVCGGTLALAELFTAERHWDRSAPRASARVR
jgi:hypothetical protein